MIYEKPKLKFRQPELEEDLDTFQVGEGMPIKKSFLPEHLSQIVSQNQDPRNPVPMDLYSMLSDKERSQRDQLLAERENAKSGLGISNALAGWADMPDNRSGQAVWDNRRSLRNEALKDFDTIAKDRRGLLDDFYKTKTTLDQGDAFKSEIDQTFGQNFSDNENLQGDDAYKLLGAKQRMEIAKQAALNKKNSQKPALTPYWWSGERQKLQSHPILKSYFKEGVGLNSAKKLFDLAKSGNTSAFSSFGTKMARAMGEVGVLTDTDVVRYITSQKLSQKVKDKLNLWAQGIPSEATTDELDDILNVLSFAFEQKARPTIEAGLKSTKEIAKMNGFEGDDEQLMRILAIEGMVGDDAQQKPELVQKVHKATGKKIWVDNNNTVYLPNGTLWEGDTLEGYPE